MTLKRYGYGIVDRRGELLWDESCVCQDREPMDEAAAVLNDPDEITDSETERRRPFCVVRLMYQVRRK